VGGVAFLLLLALLLVFCLRRRTKERRAADGSAVKNYGVGAEKRRPVDLLDRRVGSSTVENGVSREDSIGNRTVEVRGEAYRPSPFRYPSPPEVPTTASPHAARQTGLGDRVAPSSFPHGAGLAGEKHLASPRTTAGAPTSTDRPSIDSQRTTAVSNELSGSSGTPQAAGGARRSTSIAKHAATPSTGSANLPRSIATAVPSGHTTPDDSMPDQAGGDATFVEHRDAGPVM
jgi:hypothetical protein